MRRHSVYTSSFRAPSFYVRHQGLYRGLVDEIEFDRGSILSQLGDSLKGDMILFTEVVYALPEAVKIEHAQRPECLSVDIAISCCINSVFVC